MKKEYIFGLRPVIEAIEAGKEIEKIFIKNGLQGDLFFQLRKKLKNLSIPYQFVPIEKLNKLSNNDQNHQGVIALLSPIVYDNIEEVVDLLFAEGKNPLILVLDRITDVRNFGAIARTAECAGVHAIVIPNKNSAQINSDAIKTSSGALMSLPICRVEHLKDVIYLLKQTGIQIVGATEKTEIFYNDVDMKVPTTIIMGSEETGIDKNILKICDIQAKVPIMGKISSLNVSVATGIMLYEALKQRQN